MSTKTMKASVLIGGSVSSAFRGAMSTTKNGLRQIGEEIARVDRHQRLLGQQVQTFARMGKNVDRMRIEYAELTKQTDRLRTAQSRLSNVQNRMAANDARRQELGGKLRGAATTFGVIAASTLAPVRMAVEFENAMLGVAKQVEGARDSGGELTQVYFDMAKQIRHMGREIPISTNSLADMVAAGARMGVAKGELIDFTRTAAMMADAFDLPAAALADDMGKIAGLFQIPIPKIADLADAINYLDDNAQSKGGDIIDVMRRIGGMAQTLKMPAKEAAALGSTFLTLGSSAEVAGTASNAVLRILGAATAQSKKIRAGMASIGLDPAAVQKSMSKDATGTILSLLDKLNALSDEQRMVASTRIFGAEYGDDIAKLSTGADKYREQLALVNGEMAKGSVAKEFNARLKTSGAQWQLTKNRMVDVASVIGGTLLPAINSLMTSAAPMVEGFANFTQATPKLVKGVIGAALGMSALRVATLGLGYALTLAKTPVLSVMGYIARWRARSAIAGMKDIAGGAVRAASPLRAVGAAIAAIGGGPITLAVAALTVGALVVRKYWQPIAAFITGTFQGIRSAIAPAMTELGAAFAPLAPIWNVISGAIGAAFDWVMKLIAPVNMTAEQLRAAGEAGRSFGAIIGGVMAAVVRRVTAVVNAITGVATSIGNVGRAASLIPGVGTLVQGAAGAASLFGVGGERPAAGPGAARGKRPPAGSGTAAMRPRAVAASPASHTFNITQLPGESGESLARRIAAEQRRNDGVASRGRLVDEAA